MKGREIIQSELDCFVAGAPRYDDDSTSADNGEAVTAAVRSLAPPFAGRGSESHDLRPLLRMPVDDRAEQLPFLAGEFHHLHLLDRIEIRRRGLDADSRDIGVDLEI